VSAAFEMCGYDAKAAKQLFCTVFDAIVTSGGSGVYPEDEEDISTNNSSSHHNKQMLESINERGSFMEEVDDRTLSMEVSKPEPALFTPDGKPIKFARCKQCGQNVERTVESIEEHMAICEGMEGLVDYDEAAEKVEEEEKNEEEESQKKQRRMDFEMFVQAVEIAPVLVNVFSQAPREAMFDIFDFFFVL